MLPRARLTQTRGWSGGRGGLEPVPCTTSQIPKTLFGPLDESCRRRARLQDQKLIAGPTVGEVPDGPPNIGWTYPDRVNNLLATCSSRPDFPDVAGE
jgi:hypothetical protein